MNNAMQFIQMAMQIKNNPEQALSKMGIPKDIMSDPQQVVQYLMNNGKVSQDQYNNAVKNARNMGFKI